MAITDFASYEADRAAPRQFFAASKLSLTSIAGRLSSLWAVGPDAGVAPTTAAVPTSATAGALGLGQTLQNSPGQQRIIGIQGYCANPGRLILVDRLAHQGGLSGTVVTAQATNLPTAALTRYTTGVGVMAALEIYAQVGTTGTTFTASYTDEAGNPGVVSQPAPIGATGFREAGRILPFSLAAGDTGVRAVASVTVLATTGTAGNFGVTLFKPLLSVGVRAPGAFEWNPLIDNGGLAPEVLTNACLQWFFLPFTSATGQFEARVLLSED